MTGAAVTGERRESTARPVIIVVMGVSGSGKSTVGALLAARLGLPFAEGDDFHSAHARAEMAAGRPLGDQDRQPWLASSPTGWTSGSGRAARACWPARH